MNARLIFALLWLAPMLSRGASFTSYFYNVEALTNVVARSAVRGLTGTFTNSLSAAGFNTSGTTNATLTGNLLANGGTLTNGLTAGPSQIDFNTTVLTYAATTDLDLSGPNYQTLALTGDVIFTTSNRATGRWKTVIITSDGSARTFTFPAGWDFGSGTAPTGIAASKIGILTVFFRDNTDANAVATYSVQDAVVGDVTGPSSATDNALARFDLTTGKIIQNSTGAVLSDNMALTIAGATITANEPVLSVSQAWNSAGTTFTGLKIAITNTASASASLLADFQIGAAGAVATVASINRNGVIQSALGSAGAPGLSFTGNATYGVYKGSGLLGIVAGAKEALRLTTDLSDPGTHTSVIAGTNTIRVRVGGTLVVNTTAVGNITTGEDDLMTYSVGANVLSLNADHLKITCSGSFAANANNKTLKAYFGATQLFSTGALAFNAGDWVMHIEIIRTGAATQIANVSFQSGNALLTSSATVTTPAETLSSAITFKCTGEATATDDIIQKTSTVAWCKGQ